jgi:hypothetical protein
MVELTVSTIAWTEDAKVVDPYVTDATVTPQYKL